MKLRVRYTKLGKIRFTSHRDTARHFERALRKAGIRVAYSAGFTPRPKISFGLALPTGAESVAEYLDLDLEPDEGLALDELAERCTAELPIGYEVTRVVPRDAGVVSLQDAVVACTWQIALAGIDVDRARDAIAVALASPALMVARERKGQRSTDDVRPAIESLAVEFVDDDDRPQLLAELATTGRGLRPVELVAALFPHDDAVDTAARILRTHQWIECDGERREILPAQPSTARAPAGCA
jgi:radical SAM-linked protein